MIIRSVTHLSGRVLKPILRRQLNLFVAIVVVSLNVMAWANLMATRTAPYVVEPRRDREVVALLDYIRTGEHSGEEWEVTLTALEAEQTITWYLQRYPQIPFDHPQIEITPDHVSGEGDATIAGLRVHVGGRARITLVDGLPQVEILQLSLPVPGPIRKALEREIEIQLQRADQFQVRFLSAEWSAGQVVVRGVVR
jgi:hypothetical protein